MDVTRNAQGDETQSFVGRSHLKSCGSRGKVNTKTDLKEIQCENNDAVRQR
jgi:hypothetical protein